MAAVLVLGGCGAGGLVDAALGLPPVDSSSSVPVPSPVSSGPAAPSAPVPTHGGGAVQRGFGIPIPGPTPPRPPTPPRKPVVPLPPGGTPWPRFEPPTPSNWPSPAYRPACPQGNDGTSNVPSTLTAGRGSLTVTFWNPGARDIVALAVTARRMSLRAGTQPEPVTVTLPAPSSCREVTATIPGLTAGDTYQVWIEVTSRSPVDGRDRTKVVGRTGPVTIG